MGEQDEVSTKYPNEFEVYNTFRARIVAEDGHINSRLSHLIWFSASFMGSWAVVSLTTLRANLSDGWVDAIGLAIALCGAVVAGLTFWAIQAAKAEIDAAKERYKQSYPTIYSGRRVPRLTGTDLNHNVGHIVPLVLPVLYLGLFLILTVYSYIGITTP